MSSLGELFSSVGFKVDEASIKKYDAALEASKKKTDALAKQSAALLERMADLKAARDKEAAQVKEFIKLYEDLNGKQETDEEKKARVAKAMGVVGFAAAKTGEDLGVSEKKARDWAKTVIALEAGLNLASKAFGFVRGKVQGMLGDIAQAGGKAGSISALSTRVGLTTDALQELGYAAEQNASDMNTLASGWKNFSNKADSATKGGKEAARAFRTVGVSAGDLRKGKLSLDEALGKVADTFQRMEDGPKKAALAMDLFGGSGGALIPLLNQGSAGIANLRKEARDLGVVINQDGIKGLAGFDDKTVKLKTSLNALRSQALAAIIPMLTKVIDRFQEWLGKNREKAVKALTVGFGVLADVLSAVVSGFEMAAPLIALVAENLDLVTGAISGVIARLLIYKAVAAVTAAGSIAGALATGAAWLAANGPFIALGLAVAVLIRYWPQIRRGAVAAANAIRGAFVAVKDAIVGAFTKAYDWVIGKIDALKRKWTEFKDNFLPSDELIKSAVESVRSGDQRASQSASISVPSSASSRSTIINADTQINVTSNSADPKAVAVAVRGEMDVYWNGKMREAVG